MAIPIPGEVRQLLDARNSVHLSTLRADGTPRNWVVWVGLEDDYILVCTSEAIWKAKDMRHDPRVALSVTDTANPYRMAAIQGRVADVRPGQDCRYTHPISIKYTGAPFPSAKVGRCGHDEGAGPAVTLGNGRRGYRADDTGLTCRSWMVVRTGTGAGCCASPAATVGA